MKESNEQGITEEDFNNFTMQWDEIADRYPSVLEDRDRFVKLSQDKFFLKENNDMYREGALFLNLTPEFAEEKSLADLIIHLKRLEQFVEKWRTRPISCWLFNQNVEGLKERMEKLFDSISQSEIIKIYPWTTKKEVEQRFDEIRQIQPGFRLTPEQYPRNFKIKALRDARWKWSEIIEFLGPDFELKRREKELRSQGKTEREIEKILDEEFPYEKFCKAVEDSLEYDALRKRKGAAETISEKLLKHLKIGN